MLLKRNLLLIIFSLVFLFRNVNAQIDCGYAFEFSTTTPYTPLAINPPTVTLASGSDLPTDPFDVSPTDEEIFANVPLGFTFNFNGNNYTKIGVTSNGWIWFGNHQPVKVGGVIVPFTNVLLTDMPFDGIISALNGDLQGRWSSDLAAIRYFTSGTSPNRKFTVEWNNFKANDPGEGTGYCGVNRNRFDFQIMLYETTNRVEFAYNMEPYCYQGYSQFFQVGLRGESNKNVHARSVSAILNGWSSSKLGLPEARAIIKSSNPKVLAPQNARFSFFPTVPQNAQWVGNNNNWFDASNWSNGKVPFRCNDVTIPGGKSHYPELTGTEAAECKNLKIEAGASLTFKSNYQSFLSCFGDLKNDGVISNNTSNYLSLSGGEDREFGGSGSFLGTDVFITARSVYTLQNDLVLRNLSINEGAQLNLAEFVLDVYSFIQNGSIDQQNGVLVIEGDAASVIINDSTFTASQGTTFFGNGEVWDNPTNQVVPSANYNNLWVRTNKDFTVTLGTHRDFSAKHLMFYNPGAAGGRALTSKNIMLSGNLELGIDSLPGTELILDHAITRPNGQGVFAMGNTDHLRIRRNIQGLQVFALNGFGSPVFTGDVTYDSDGNQGIIKGKYNNLNIKGSGQRNVFQQVDVAGVLKVEDGQLNTNDSLTIKSDSVKTGLISGQGNGSIQGSVNVERYIDGQGEGFQLLASAFQDANISDIISHFNNFGADGVSWNNVAGNQGGIPLFWKYDNSLVDEDYRFGFKSYTQASAQLKAGEGYSMKTLSGEVVKMKGNVNSGLIQAPLKANVGGEYNASGWNLLGNPYPSPIDWNKVVENAPATMHRAYFTSSSNNHFSGNYAVYLPLGSTSGLSINGASRHLMALEGFFVKADESDTLRFKNEHRVEVVKKEAVSISEDFAYLKLRLVRNDKADEALIYFNENNQNNSFSKHKDALKPAPLADAFYLASKKNMHNLAIQGREILQTTDTIPLVLNIVQQGSYQIRMADVVNLNPTTTIFLEDRLNNTLQNLGQQPIVNLFLNEGLSDGRFFLQLRAGVSVNAFKESCSGGDGRIHIFNPSITPWEYKIYNEENAMIAQYGSFSGSRNIEGLPAGNYRIVFRLEAENLEVDYITEVLHGSKIAALMEVSATEVTQDDPEVTFYATSPHAQGYFWDFGDGMMQSGLSEVSHYFNEPGEYRAKLTVTRDECSDTTSILIRVLDDVTSIGEDPTKDPTTFVIYPNPAKSIARIRLDIEKPRDNMEMNIIDLSGKMVQTQRLGRVSPGEEISVDVSKLSQGIYQIILYGENFKSVSKLIVGSK